MKKFLFILGILVIITSIFISCNNNQAVEDKTSTTAVADAKGVTHFYEVLTIPDEKPEKTTLIEIVTNKSGKAITDKQGDYLTISNKTPYSVNTTNNTTTTKSSTTVANKGKAASQEDDKIATEKHENDNNDVSFETSGKSNNNENERNKTSDKTTFYTTSSKTEITDKDGWINKWY